jgi:sulfite reductase (ferredoxin)
VSSEKISLDTSFEVLALQLNKNEPTEEFANAYVKDAKAFLKKVAAYRKLELEHV